jgi:hypothetical protein
VLFLGIGYVVVGGVTHVAHVPNRVDVAYVAVRGGAVNVCLLMGLVSF